MSSLPGVGFVLDSVSNWATDYYQAGGFLFADSHLSSLTRNLSGIRRNPVSEDQADGQELSTSKYFICYILEPQIRTRHLFEFTV